MPSTTSSSTPKRVDPASVPRPGGAGVSATALRTHRAGELTRAHVGQQVRLGGWVHRRRDLGGLVFIDLRDRAGLVQLSCNPDWTPAEVMARAATAGAETVVLVTGQVALRPEPSRDEALGSRDVEVHVTDLEIAGPAQTPAIPVARKEKEELAAEELRLKHRVLDLRRPELQRNIVLRHRLMQRARRTLTELEFLEIETPILTKPTPEGARDYLVPSRIHPGEFYALPQSPQIYKQLLMVAGYDRYFQIARCFRDEDLRADRQPEFTQIDLEASFVSAEDIQQVVERILVDLWDEGGVAVPRPFPRLAWLEAMERFGIDKPDLRYRARDSRPDAAGRGRTPPPSWPRRARPAGGSAASSRLAAPRLRGRSSMRSPPRSRKPGPAGCIWARRTAAGWEGQGVKAVGQTLLDAVGGAEGDLLLAVAGADTVTAPALHAVRSALARRPDTRPLDRARVRLDRGLPAIRARPGDGRPRAGASSVHGAAPGRREPARHRPGTRPCAPLRRGVQRQRAGQRFDPHHRSRACSGGSSACSVMPEAEIRRRFGFLLDGLAAGAPPHGGFALGFDRIAMLLAGAASLRDVIAFPKTTAARALFEGAPTPVDPNDLRALHLQLADE